MCLPFYSVPIRPPNDKSRTLVGRLKILFWIQLVLAIIKCFFMTSQSGDSYLDLFACCALYLAYSQINHLGCVIHIFLSFYSIISEFVVVGTFIQNGTPLFSKTNSNLNFYMVIVIISILFYIAALYIVFQSYKEFKALSIEGLLNQPDNFGGGYFDQEDEPDYPQQNYQPQQYYQPQPQPQPQAQNRPASSNNNNPQRNENVQMTSTASNNRGNTNNSSPFKAFTGTGVKVGGS